MNFVEASKTVAALDNALTTAQTHAPVIDTIGFAHASIDVCFQKVAAAGTNSAVATVLKIQQGDGTTYVDIAACVGGSVNGFAIPVPSSTAVDAVVRFDIDTKGASGRYLRVQATGNAAGSIYTVARLSKGEIAPWDAASTGVLRTVATQLGRDLAPAVTVVN